MPVGTITAVHIELWLFELNWSFELFARGTTCIVVQSTNISNDNILCAFELFFDHFELQGVPQKHGNSTVISNWISSLLWISIVISNFKSHNIVMSARVNFIKRVKDCKDVSIMSPQEEQWWRTSLLCLHKLQFSF